MSGRRLLTTTTPLSHADIARMHLDRTSEHHAQRAVPAWAFNKTAIRVIVTEKLRRYARTSGCSAADISKTSDIGDLDELARKAQRKFRESNKSTATFNIEAHIAATAHRTLTALWIYEVYCAYRLGHRSTDIAAFLGMRPETVRQHLRRLNLIAKKLFPELCIPARDYGGPLDRESHLESQIADLERRIARAAANNKHRGRLPDYTKRLGELRTEKERRQQERRAATIFTKAA